jgi:hypothetical protein
MRFVWQCAEAVFLNPWVTSYVMPVFLGSWLVMIAANVIYIRDMKARVLTELVELQLRLGALDFETHNELDAKTTLMYQALLLIGEDLTRRGYFTYEAYLYKTYSDHTAVVIYSIKKALAVWLPQMTEKQRQAFATNPGETRLPSGFAKDVRREILKMLASRIDSDVNRLYLLRSDWAAVFGLETVAKFIASHRIRPAPRVTTFASTPPIGLP